MFLETPRFPTNLAFGAEGGAMFQTDIVTVAGGNEYRNVDWVDRRGAWDVGLVTRPLSEWKTVNAFFHVTRGRAYGFRFKDHLDYTVESGEGIVQDAGGSPSALYLFKRYTAGSTTYDRRISKPVSGTVTISGSGSYSVDYTTGIVTVLSGAAPTGWTGQFDVPVRFDTDKLRAVAFDKGSDGQILVQWPSIPIVEIAVPA